jgi:hypothetical protein
MGEGVSMENQARFDTGWKACRRLRKVNLLAVLELIEADEEAGELPADFSHLALPGALVIGFQERDQVGQATRNTASPRSATIVPPPRRLNKSLDARKAKNRRMKKLKRNFISYCRVE